jgi:hypothetical protein
MLASMTVGVAGIALTLMNSKFWKSPKSLELRMTSVTWVVGVESGQGVPSICRGIESEVGLGAIGVSQRDGQAAGRDTGVKRTEIEHVTRFGNGQLGIVAAIGSLIGVESHAAIAGIHPQATKTGASSECERPAIDRLRDHGGAVIGVGIGEFNDGTGLDSR